MAAIPPGSNSCHAIGYNEGMNEQRKSSGAVVWATVMVFALVAYPLSWGLWLRYMPQGVIADSSAATAWGLYEPLRWAVDHGPDWFVGPYAAFLMWCSGIHC
jgi:hypothetical protein